MDRREAARALQRGGARGREAEGHRAEDPAGEHGLLEVDHRASRRTGRVTLSYVCPRCRRDGAGSKERERKEEQRRVENEVMNVLEAEEPREADAAGGGVTWKAAS